MNRIYFDYSATTPVDLEVLKTIEPYFNKKFGNPSSAHGFGQEAMAGVDWARERAADFLGCQSSEVIFTSGATESNNLALRGVALAQKGKGKHIITSRIEHPAVLEVCQELEKEKFEVTYLSVTKEGVMRVEEVEKAIRPDTFLVSIMYVNNEVGTIQPIREIGQLLADLNKSHSRIYFHTDAVQAVNYCNCDVNYLGVDLLSLSGHKIYGPKGIGALYLKKGTAIKPVQYGGHQEGGLRPGTLNAPGIIGLGKAIEIIKSQKPEVNDRIKKLRDKLAEGVLNKIPNAIFNGDKEKRVPSNAHFSFKNAEGESMMIMLDMEGIAVSTGSACSTGNLKPSHVLTAMGIPPEVAHGSLRITLGKFNTEAEVDRFLEVLPGIVKRLREVAPK